MENNNNKLIPVTNSLISIEKQLTIGDKIINKKIEELFNKAFKLINSKNIDVNSNHNYLADFLKDESLLVFERGFTSVENFEDYLIALEIFDLIIDLDDKFKLAYYFKGLIYKENACYRYKEDVFDLFFRNFKLNSGANSELFENECLFNFSKALQVDVNFICVLISRIELICFEIQIESKYNIALIDCDNLINIDPNNSDYYRIKANVLYTLGYKNIEMQNDSLSFYKYSLKLNNNNIRTYNNLGRAYLLSENKDLARECFSKAIEIAQNELINKPNNSLLYYYIGYAKIGLFKREGAFFALNKSIELKNVGFMNESVMLEIVSRNKKTDLSDSSHNPITMFNFY